MVNIIKQLEYYQTVSNISLFPGVEVGVEVEWGGVGWDGVYVLFHYHCVNCLFIEFISCLVKNVI